MDVKQCVESWADFTSELLNNSCDVILCYEDYLKDTRDLKNATSLASAMRVLKNSIPKELLEAYRNGSM